MSLDTSEFPNKKLNEALSKKKYQKAINLIDKTLTKVNFENFLGGLKRSKWLISADGDKDRLRSVNEFFVQISTLLVDRLDEKGQAQLDEAFCLINYINDCFLTLIRKKMRQ